MYSRILDLLPILTNRSIFLFGPRQVGKSTYLKSKYPTAKYYNLLKADEFAYLASRPESIRQSIVAKDKLIIIDEIQKLPILLDEVQAILGENKKIRFILTGSSARRLKRGGANLLAGRAYIQRMHPLLYPELKDHFKDFMDLHKFRCNRGGIPFILDSPFPEHDLLNYIGTYLHEEILAEGLSRGVQSFAKFLEVVATTNGEEVNFVSVANDVGVSPRIIKSYYTILEDTLIGYLLPTYTKTVKRKATSTPKFYFFDVAIANKLLRRKDIEQGSEVYGRVLEHLIFIELKGYIDYTRLDANLTYWRSRSKLEVDFLIDNRIGIEVKAGSRIATKDEKGLLALNEDLPKLRKIIVCHEPHTRVTDNGTEIIPLHEFMIRLWNGEIVN
jgi:uncharacterized protein